ncbi:hypothetical protein VTN77DRAFT_549 [Rasamsonia byssochlamydoides]|uniref:uncharacterized protein n=1 Tax=Rasamsonia byssochlamydoides TaxID=89139 RepID=UPI003743243F
MGLYYWNTTSPLYQQIVTAPTYLSLTFQLNALNTANFMVKVPFALLNLTLEAPLVSTPTQHFPCFTSNSTYGLGRAFLQAAFIGVNWSNDGTGNWFLAQAPGPNYQATPSLTNIAPADQSLVGSQNSWQDTWAGHWTPLPEPSNAGNAAASSTPSGSSSSDSSSLSTGAKAGIGVGVSIGGLLILGAVILFFFRRRRQQGAIKPEGASLPGPDSQAPAVAVAAAAAAAVEQDKPYRPPDPNNQTYGYYAGQPAPAPLPVPQVPVELDNHSGRSHELQS